jgi:hypothetical protein
LVIAWLMLMPARKEARPPTAPLPSPTGVTQNGKFPEGYPQTPVALPHAISLREGPAFIQAVRLQPTHPTRRDSLKAEVEAAPVAPPKLSYTYRWKVNDLIVVKAAEDTLDLSAFKKGDLVTVTVTPHDGNTAGAAVESPLVAIHSVPPSLELAAMRRVRKSGEPIELQLVGAAPEGEVVGFSLEEPHVPGMTVDKTSGRIIWHLQPDQKGVFRFGAAVEDNSGTKVTRIFEIKAD